MHNFNIEDEAQKLAPWVAEQIAGGLSLEAAIPAAMLARAEFMERVQSDPSFKEQVLQLVKVAVEKSK